jgi:hypothetical protein
MEDPSMVAVTSLLAVLLLSLIIVRIAAEALVLTGLSREAARFQARSAWTGTGFTTAESERVVGHPVRRRVVEWLMVLRSAGLVRLFLLLGGLAALWLFARSRWIERRMARAIAWALKRWTDLDARDYAGLLHLAGEYAIMELKVRDGSWLAGRTLDELRLPQEGVLVLGIVYPDETYLSAPRGGTPRPGGRHPDPLRPFAGAGGSRPAPGRRGR